VDQPGWLFWRPKTLDGTSWYLTAYWHEHGKSQLLKSNDGRKWDTVSYIWEGERNDETDFEFMADGRIISTGVSRATAPGEAIAKAPRSSRYPSRRTTRGPMPKAT